VNQNMGKHLGHAVFWHCPIKMCLNLGLHLPVPKP